MESLQLQPLATESFSYSWLTDKGQGPVLAIDGLNQVVEDQERRYDDLVFKSNRFSSFNFDVPVSEYPVPTLVDADEIFLDGHIMPLYSSFPATPVTLGDRGRSGFSTDKKRLSWLLGKWRESSRRLFRKWFKFLGLRKSTRVAADIDRKDDEGDDDDDDVHQVMNVSRSNSSGVVSCDSDNSISEAVLHCKRSISM